MKKTNVGKRRAARKCHRNFLMVNMAEWQRKELETLCRQHGRTLRDMARYAVAGIKDRLSAAIPPDSSPGHGIAIGLTLGELRGLKFFARDFTFGRGENLSVVARYILLLALARPTVVKTWLSGLVNYCDAEGVDQKKFLADTVARQREYRRVKVPIN